MKCKKCGFEIKENKKFCTNCGWEIELITLDKSEELPTKTNVGNLFDNLTTQPVLILFVLLIKLFLDIENFLLGKDIYFIANELLILLTIFQIIALFTVIIISIQKLYIEKSFSKFANYLYLALSIALLSTTIESLIFFQQIQQDIYGS